MMHAQSVGIAPSAPGPVTATRLGSGNQRRYELSWSDTSKNETAFVIQRRVAGSTADFTTIATVQSSVLGVAPYVETGVGPGTGTRTYIDRIGNTNTLFEYQVYAINVVGDVWDYSNPAFNNIPPGGGFPTLTLDSRGGTVSAAVTAPSNLTGAFTVKNRKTATVNLTWTDNATNETGFLVQRAENPTFFNPVNTTIAGNLTGGTTSFSQTVTPGKIYFFRVLAFNDTHQSGWSNTVSLTIP